MVANLLGAKFFAGVVTGVLALALPLAPQMLNDDGPHGNSNAANKTSVVASDLVVMTAPVVDGAASDIVSLLSTTIKTGGPKDLAVQLTLECSLFTQLSVVNDESQTAIAGVNVWVLFDGVPLPVASGDDGVVTFCNRAYNMAITQLDDEDARFDSYIATKAAHGFNWAVLNTGSGTHTIEIVGQLEAFATDAGEAQAIVGKRTLIVEPVHLQNGATL
jgi:hypothetical protein